MNVTCNDRDRIFEDGTLAEWRRWKHTQPLPALRGRASCWKSLSFSAQELRDYAESPTLWLRIERALAEEAERKTQRAERRRWHSFFQHLPVGWQMQRPAPSFWF